jgi:hypothetical protein
MLISMAKEEVAPEIAELRRVKRLRKTAETAQADATKATEPAIVAALKAGHGPSVIAAECGVTDSHVRAVRRKHNLPANPSYANLTTPTTRQKPEAPLREPEPWAAPSVLHPDAGPDVSALAVRIPPPDAARLVRMIADRNGIWHAEQQQEMAAAGIPLPKRPYVEIGRALDPSIGIIDESEVPQ